MTTLIASALLATMTGAKPVSWHIRGDLSEACSCSLPCACNFGESPSPHAFCDAVFSVHINRGTYAGIKLDGLNLAGAQGEKGGVFYIDDRATGNQAKALTAITREIVDKMYKANKIDPKNVPDGFALLGIDKAKISQNYDKKRASLMIEGHGGFESDYIMGMDGKTPVTVGNNWSWNMVYGYKAKTKKLSYKDQYGNEFDFEGTNSNQGPVDWSNKTTVYLR